MYAEPANLDVRVVLADLLQQAGDPRGEFIALQLAIGRDPDGNLVGDGVRKRAAALLAADVGAWIAGLPDVVPGSVRFANGFLAAFRTRASARALEDTFADPRWATVEELAIEHQPDLRKLLEATPALRALHVEHASTLNDLERLGPHAKLRAISTHAGDWLPADRDAFPNLEVAGLDLRSTSAVDRVMVRAGQLHLRAVVATIDDHQLQRVLAERERGPELRLAIVSSVSHPLPQLRPAGWWVRLRPAEARADISWGGGPDRFALVLARICETLTAAGIEDVSIYAPGPHRPKVRQRLRWGAPVRWEVSGFDLFE